MRACTPTAPGLIGRLDRSVYPGLDRNWDNALFRDRVLAQLSPEHDMLDLGAGAGIVGQMDFRGHARRICGVDPDPRVEANPFLHEGRVARGESIPYPDGSFDLVVSDNVLEHLQRPVEVFREVGRVLRSGGVFLAKTPNRWHYVALVARATPESFHRMINRRRGREEEDTFPTCYRANSRAQIARLAEAADLELLGTELIESRPEYMRLSVPTYLAGIAYEKLVNSAGFLARFRAVLIATLRKPQE